MVATLRSLPFALAWLVCALAVSIGTAGLVAAANRAPGTDARAELTWAADEAARPALRTSVSSLRSLQLDVEGLGRAGRGALAALVGGDDPALSASLTDGTARVARIDVEARAIADGLALVPGMGAGRELRLGSDVRGEYDAIETALGTTVGLGTAWANLTAGSAAADRLTALLASHDTLAAAAARQGSTGAYAQALATLARASAALDSAVTLRDAVANTADVSVLDQWIARNRAIDAALTDLYTALRTSKGAVTPAVRTALAAEKAAQAQLPPDTRGLVVILGDIARGGLNQAVIQIEDARGRLAAAIGGLPDGTASGG